MSSTLGPVVDIEGVPIRVGTCSWTDATLVEESQWYPRRSMSAAERLAFYAEHFPIAEADSTYYFPPTRQLTRGWADRTPAGFVMDVKAYSLLTGHPTRPASLWRDLRDDVEARHPGKRNVYAHHLAPESLDEAWLRFTDALVPLDDAGKLGAVLFQYPRWFTAKRANREELGRVRERLGPIRASVELRSPTWFAPDDLDRTLGTLRDHDLALVVVDAPPVSELPTVTATTADLAVVRFHGRADDTWNLRTGSAAERFRYLYEPAELRDWLPRLRELAAAASEVHALMNNCYRDFGVRNASDLLGLLTG